MSSSYKPVAIGIPVSQNPYPSLPYSQNFPNEPDTESSQPLNNPPKYYYPPIYGQQPVPMNQPGQFYQQPQYMMVPVDPERIKLGAKIADIDTRLDSGWYFVYKIHLWLSIIGSAVWLSQLSFCLVVFLFLGKGDFSEFQMTTAQLVTFKIVATVVLLFLIALCLWTLHYSAVFKNAMSNKSLEGARRGFKSMVANFICGFVLIICVIAAIELMINVSSHHSKKENWVPYYVQAIVYLYALPTFLQLFGAKKVMDLLAERKTFVHELNTKFGTNLA